MASLDTYTFEGNLKRKELINELESLKKSINDPHGSIKMLDDGIAMKRRVVDSYGDALEFIRYNHRVNDKPFAVRFNSESGLRWMVGGWCVDGAWIYVS